METLIIDGALASYEVSDKEVLTDELFTTLVCESRKHNDVLNLDVLLTTDRHDDRELLTTAGFSWAGTAQVNRNGQAVTFIRYRVGLKRSMDGNVAGDGTYNNTTLASSSFEQNAVAEMARRTATPLTPERLKYLDSIGKQPVPAEESIDERLARLLAEDEGEVLG